MADAVNTLASSKYGSRKFLALIVLSLIFSAMRVLDVLDQTPYTTLMSIMVTGYFTANVAQKLATGTSK